MKKSTSASTLAYRTEPGLLRDVPLKNSPSSHRTSRIVLALLKFILPFQRFWREKVKGYAWFSRLNENLYLGGVPYLPEDYEWIEREGIGAVLNMCSEWSDDEKYFIDHHIVYLNLEVEDMATPNLNQTIAGILFIEAALKSRKRVLVHCAKGRGRSATVVCAYLMWKQKLPLGMAERKLQSLRSLVSLLPSQIEMLRQFEGKINTLMMSSKSPQNPFTG